MGHTNTAVTQAWAARFHHAAQMGRASEGLVPNLATDAAMDYIL